MKILVINGSPRGTHGTTWWVLERFIQGMRDAGGEVETIHLAGKKISPCNGDLACWFQTPGQCIHHDDMDPILAALSAAETCVLGTPIYVDGMTGLLKNCIDRMIPLVDPHFELRDGHLRHPPAGHLPARYALVATCGFSELDNFDPLVMHIRAICRNASAAYAGAILRPAAPILPFGGMLHPFKTYAVAKAIRKGGEELVRTGKISQETEAEAAAEIISRESYERNANKHFEKMLKKLKPEL
jgi:putative NADPH-quinone reductase